MVNTKADISVNSANGGYVLRPARATVAAGSAATVTSKTVPAIRLTVRGRVVFTALLVALLASVTLGISNIFAGSAQAETDLRSGANEFGYFVPMEGDSLWSVAEMLDPGADPRDIVQEIVEFNQLSDSGLRVYEPIAVPLRYAERPGVQSAAEVGL